MTVPVHVISGFLGAGKTTVIRAQLTAREHENVAVIVNDFGEAALDEAALEETSPFALTNIPGGCVCCTAPEGFVDALGAVLEQKPDRLWIEPTGLARPQDIIDTIRRCVHRDALELEPVLVLIDPAQLTRHQNAPDTFALLREQAQAADILVASRADLATASELAAFQQFAAELWPPPLATLTCENGNLPHEALHWPEGEGGRAPRESACGPEGHDSGAHHHKHSTTGFHARSWRWKRDVVFDRTRLTAALQHCVADAAPLGLERFKGIFRTLEGVSRFEIAGGMLHDRLTSFRRDSRADAIVRGDGTSLDRIEHLLASAALSDDELNLDTENIEIVLPNGTVHAVDRDTLLALPHGVPDVGTIVPKRAGAAARISELFNEIGITGTGQAVVVAGDGFAAEPVSLEVLREGLLIHSLEDAPLSSQQGGPFRLLIPEATTAKDVSCANVKGVAKIAIR